MAKYTGVKNGGEDVFCGGCGGYSYNTSMNPVSQSSNRVQNSSDNSSNRVTE
jgi:hypothetical protein